MSFDKNYPNRKDKRRAYRKGKRGYCDRTCRNHGSCPYCRAGRLHQAKRQQPAPDWVEEHYNNLYAPNPLMALLTDL